MGIQILGGQITDKSEELVMEGLEFKWLALSYTRHTGSFFLGYLCNFSLVFES